MKILGKLIFAVLIICLAASVSWAAMTTVKKGGTINITPDASSNWNCVTDGTSPTLTLTSIVFVPSSATDVLVVRDEAAGPVIFPSSTDIIGMSYSGLACKPYILRSECTFATPANVKILMFYK